MTPALLLLLACLQAAPAVRAPELYGRVVKRSTERAQRALLATLNFEVDHSRFEDPWIVTTAHYELRATVSYAQTKKLAEGLEFVRGEFAKLLGEPKTPHGGRNKIWVLPSFGGYNAFGLQNGAEVHSSVLGSYYFAGHAEQPVISYQNGNDVLLGMWITHSALHQYLEQNFGPQSQVWVDEGLASYFALFWDWPYGAARLEELEKSRDYVPLERLLREPLEAYLSKPDPRFIELGMLFHFLLNSCEATKNGATGDPSSGPFQEFLRAAVRGQDVSDSEFTQTFEEASALLEQDFKAFDFAKQ